MPDRDPSTDPRIGDRLIHKNGALTLTVTGVGNIITWRIDGGTAPMHFNDPPAEYARLFNRSLATGTTFVPASAADSLSPVPTAAPVSSPPSPVS